MNPRTRPAHSLKGGDIIVSKNGAEREVADTRPSGRDATIVRLRVPGTGMAKQEVYFNSTEVTVTN